MVAIKTFDPIGVQIVDEIVRCNESVTIGTFTGYKGYLNNTCNPNIEGNTSTVNTVYDAVNKTGNRLFALTKGYPADTSTVAIDLKNGWVYSTVSKTVYVSYLAHEPIKHSIAPLKILVPYQLKSGVAKTIIQRKYPYFVKFGYATVDIQGGLPTSNVTLILTNGTESQTITLSSTVGQSVIEFTTPMKLTTAETLTLSTANGYNAFGIALHLLDV